MLRIELPEADPVAPMMTRLELGRIAGIPVFLDMMLVLILVTFSWRYFTSGDVQLASAGLIIIAGICLSIFLHELAHALVAKLFRTGVSHIDLTGLGGVTHFDRSLPRSVIARTLIYVAGPLANLGLWYLFEHLGAMALGSPNLMPARVAFALGSINLQLFIFNMLPAYPLDGGHVLDAWIERIGGQAWANRIVGVLGLLVAAWLSFLAIQAMPEQVFLLLLAFFIAQVNWEALQNADRFRR